MENMSNGLVLMGLGIGTVFGLMIAISLWIWGLGKVYGAVESRAKARKKAAKASE